MQHQPKVTQSDQLATARETPNDRFLRIRDVCDLIARGRTWVTDRVRSGEFPQPVRIGVSTLWVESQVRQWMAERIAESQQKASAA